MTGVQALALKFARAAHHSASAAWRAGVGTPAAPTALPPTVNDSPKVTLTFARETELRDPVAAWVATTWMGAHVADEVGPRWAPADLVAEVPPVGHVPGALVSVELKLRDARKALAQATLHQLFVDLSYIAMPAHRVTSTLLTDAVSHGVGVLGVQADGSVHCLAEAAQTTRGDALSISAAEVVRASATGVRGPVPIGGSPGGTPALTTP